MKKRAGNRIVYSICVDDIQEIAQEDIGRVLTDKEVALVERELGDYVDWSQAISHTILNVMHLQEK